ncbi:MAG: succinylglutamate desuccinylase/aspartoacylase family protein [Proteobacteria bacterium]|nr:succinylglutamate desuccinylase/aspartoacylase family protein [Pseudomonadota bacterium]
MVRIRITEEHEGIEGVTLYEALAPSGRTVAGPRVAIVGGIHGDEPVGLRALDRLRDESGKLVAGSLLAVVGNPVASGMGLRHTPDGQDLNRLFDAKTLDRLAHAPVQSLNAEERRARAIGPLLAGVDAILDLHSTSRPAPPFLLFRDDQRHQRLGLRLGVEHLVTGMHESSVVAGGLACNAGLNSGERTARLGFTFEAGEHTAPGNASRAWDVVTRLLHALGIWADVPEPADIEPRVYEVMERFAQSPEGMEPWRFVGYSGAERGSERSGPPRQLQSFEHIEAGEVVLKRGGHHVVRAAAPFTMLMPAPTAGPGADLYFMLQPRHGGLMRAEGPRTDLEARREAEAIERMLDLLDADGFDQGATQLSFDPRVVLGLCASEIERIATLPEGSPHRRLSVVGRGDWGSGESDRRAGQRYRRAMRRAIRTGVSIDRFQLLRGASLGWLDALTGEGMGQLLRERALRPDVSDIRMYVSDRQPHTVSLLVLGDVDLALRTGDYRAARVAVVVEAATVEPDEGEVRVHVVRSGLLSARREVLVATHRFLSVLRRQHRALLQSPALRVVHEKLPNGTGPDGALIPRPGQLEPMRVALRSLQVQRWCEQLDPALVPGEVLSTPAERGQWLARTVVASGVHDLEALKTILRQEEQGWTVDGAALSRWTADPMSVAPSPPQPAHGPRQPLSAAEVDGDSLERWIGWKRYLRTGQLIPGTQGRDVGLALTTHEIHRRIAQIYARARALGADRPGDVRVIVCGDGAMPRRERLDTGSEVLAAHRGVLRDPNVSYLRIQHASGTHAAWLKDFLQHLAARPNGAASAAVQWEPDHGASINAIMLATRERGAPTRPFSLDGWRIRACGVALQAFAEQEREYELALFTGQRGLENTELLAFARAHAEGLLIQGGGRLLADGGPVDPAQASAFGEEQLGRWIRRLRRASKEPGWPTTDDPAAVRRAVAHLGLEDAVLGLALVSAAASEDTVVQAAHSTWEAIVPWPGSRWAELLGSDYTAASSSTIDRAERRTL